MADDHYWMSQALEQAVQAERDNEVPVGAVLVKDDEAIGLGCNQPIGLCDPSAHAEVLALRDAASRLGNYRLPDTTLYVTLEPCVMCVGAILQARIKRLVFGAFDRRTGAVASVFELLAEPCLNHRVLWLGGVMQDACADLLRRFFKQRR